MKALNKKTRIKSNILINNILNNVLEPVALVRPRQDRHDLSSPTNVLYRNSPKIITQFIRI